MVRSHLTSREIQILQLVAEGLSSKEIAVQLGIRYRTVETHKSHIYDALNAKNVAHAVFTGVRLGIINVATDSGNC